MSKENPGLDPGLDCLLCKKRFKNKHTLSSHKTDAHDGKDGRLHSLVCPVSLCGKSFQYRSKFTTHLSEHSKSSTTSDMYLCPRCDMAFIDVPTRDKHLDTCESPARKALIASSEDTMHSIEVLRGNLVSHTGNLVTAEYLMDISCPIVLTLDDDSKVALLGTPSMAELLQGRRIVEAKVTSGFGSSTSNPTHLSLSQALLVHHYGKIILDDVSLYEALDRKTCNKAFRSSASRIAKKLAGALIHSLANVLLVLKVEIYGRKESEDPHQLPLAFPALEPYTVRSIEHDGTTKILIGTASWLALVTSSVQLNTGNVVVGPHNTHFTPHARTSVYIRSDYKKNVVVERHLRSKFHLAETYLKCAGIFYLFQQSACLPFTMPLLHEHFLPKKTSGIRTVAAIFFRLYQDEGLSQTHLADQLQDATADTSRISRDIITLQHFMEESDDNMVKVTMVISQQLRVLCEHAVGTITDLNHSVVKREVETKIEAIINARG